MSVPVDSRFEPIDDMCRCETTYLEARRRLDELRLAYRRNPTRQIKEAWWGALEAVLQAGERRERAMHLHRGRQVGAPGETGGGDRI